MTESEMEVVPDCFVVNNLDPDELSILEKDLYVIIMVRKKHVIGRGNILGFFDIYKMKVLTEHGTKFYDLRDFTQSTVICIPKTLDNLEILSKYKFKKGYGLE